MDYLVVWQNMHGWLAGKWPQSKSLSLLKMLAEERCVMILVVKLIELITYFVVALDYFAQKVVCDCFTAPRCYEIYGLNQDDSLGF